MKHEGARARRLRGTCQLPMFLLSAVSAFDWDHVSLVLDM